MIDICHFWAIISNYGPIKKLQKDRVFNNQPRMNSEYSSCSWYIVIWRTLPVVSENQADIELTIS